MGSGEVGGDGSVQWDLHGNNIISHSESSNNPKHQQHKAKDKTDPSDLYFHVTIKLPQAIDQKDEFLGSLQEGLSDGQAGKDVTFKLRIEDKYNNGPTKDQIKIAWTSLGDSGPGQAPKITKPSAPRRSASRSASTSTSKKASNRRKRKSGKRR
jgi:hypothetical protein